MVDGVLERLLERNLDFLLLLLDLEHQGLVVAEVSVEAVGQPGRVRLRLTHSMVSCSHSILGTVWHSKLDRSHFVLLFWAVIILVRRVRWFLRGTGQFKAEA